MAAEKIKIEGLRQLNASLRKFDAELGKAPRKINREAATLVAGTAKGRAPRRSGRLAGSIRPGATGTSSYVQSTLIYARQQEYGGKHGIARHYLSGAIAEDTPAIVALYEKRVGELAKQIKGK